MAWKTVKDNGILLQFPTGGTDSLRVVFDTHGGDVAYVVPDGADGGNANAALISNAPTLLMACRRVWDAVLECHQHDIPDELLRAAFDCRHAAVAVVTGNDVHREVDDWIKDRRRAQNRARQQLCRARKKSAKEATDGQSQN